MNSHFGSPGYMLARAFCMNFSPIYILKPQTCLRLFSITNVVTSKETDPRPNNSDGYLKQNSLGK